MDFSKMTDKELEDLKRRAEIELKNRSNNDIIQRLLSNRDFLTNFLRSKEYNDFCKSQGFDLSEEDRVGVALPKYLELFTGGRLNA